MHNIVWMSDKYDKWHGRFSYDKILGIKMIEYEISLTNSMRKNIFYRNMFMRDKK